MSPSALGLSSGDDVICRATVTDSLGGVSNAELSVSMADTPPMIQSTATVTPQTAMVGEVLTCSMTAVDAEDGVLTTDYRWVYNGTDLGFGASIVIDASIPVNSIIGCIASAEDSTGNIVTSMDSMTVLNSPPVISNLQITPTPVFLNTAPVCNVTASDDNGSVTTQFTWTNNGLNVGATDTLDLTTITHNIDDLLVCSVQISDSNGAIATASEQAVIQNQLPIAPIIEITPTEPIAEDQDIVCTITSGLVDADGQVLTPYFQWYQNGLPYSTTQTIAANHLIAGDVWVCEVRTYDGFDYSPASTTSVTIESPCYWGDCDESTPLINTGMDWVHISNGLFEMGSPLTEVGRYSREDLHYVYLSNDIFVMTTEVTQEMFQTLM